MDKLINIFIVALSVIIGFIGFIFVLKIWLVWKKVDLNLLKARVYLSPEFLMRNWVYIFIAGAFIVMRRILQLIDLLDFSIINDKTTIIFDIMGLAVVALLVILSYFWYKLVNSAIEHHDRKDAPIK